MKEFRLSPHFYIISILILSIPASCISPLIHQYLNNLDSQNALHQLAGNSLVEVLITIVLVMVFFWLANNWLWRIKGVTKVFPIPHDINGRYKGTLISSYDQDKTYDIYIEIEQTLTKVSLCLYRENSFSKTIIASLGKNEDGKWCLYYIYEHKVSKTDPDKNMKDHVGMAFLEIFNDGAVLKGNYFNNPRDRGRHGTIDAKRVGRNILGKYR